MKTLLLRPGSVLLHVLDSIKDGQAHEDVSARAVEFLFAPLELDPNLTVRDLFGLFTACPDLLVVYRRFYAAELCAQAAKGALTANGGNITKSIVLYRSWEVNSRTREYACVPMLRLSGLGPCPTGQESEFCPDGDQMVHYALDGADLRYLLDVPLHFNKQVIVYEADDYSTRFLQPVNTVTCTELSLGEVLQAVIWNLNWAGDPEEAQEALEDTHSVQDHPESWEDVSFDELMEEQFGEDARRGWAALFESTGDCDPMEVSSALREIPDHDNAQQWLQQHVDENISVKPTYRHLGGRDFRQAFFEVQVEK